MPKSIKEKMQALKDNGSYKDGMSDEDISNAFEKMGEKDEPKKDEPKANADYSLIKAIEALTNKVASLETQINAKDESEKDSLVAELKDLDTGLTEKALKTVEVSVVESLHHKHTGHTVTLNGARKSQQATAEDYADSFLNVESK